MRPNKSLYNTIVDDEPVIDSGLFGIHGGHVNCTDGRYVYMRGPTTEDINHYTNKL